MGGMFDPVHVGHVAAARHAVELLALDELRLLPCARPNHRGPASEEGRHRLHMLELACADEPRLRPDPMELDRPGISYSVDSLEALRAEDDSRQLVFVMGADAFAGLTRWHRWQRLLALCHLLVLGREGAAEPDFDFHSRTVADAGELFATAGGNILISRNFSMPASSTKVREALRQEAATTGLLDPAVASYIEEQQLYRIQTS